MVAKGRRINVPKAKIKRQVKVFPLGSLRVATQDEHRFPTSDTAHSVQQLEEMLNGGWSLENMTANEKQLICVLCSLVEE